MDKRVIEVDFFGEKISLKTQGDPEVVEEAIDLAMIKMANAKQRTKHGAPHRLAILALLDLAEEYVKAKERVSALKHEMGEKSEQINKLIEAEI